MSALNTNPTRTLFISRIIAREQLAKGSVYTASKLGFDADISSRADIIPH
jgi:hypothetical protein